MKKYLSFFAAALLMTFAACNNVDEPDNGGGTTVGNDGSKEKPYTVSEAISKQGQTDKWVKGYIVGAVKGLTIVTDSVELAAPFTANTNLLVAESATETDLSKMMPVQLSAGAFREALNLPIHPTNLGKEVMLKGALTTYFSKPGIKSLSDIVFEGYVPPATTIDICSDAAFAGYSTYSNDFEDAVANTDYIKEGWQNVAVSENRRFQGKTFQDNGYVQATAHGGTAGKKYESWIVSPALNLEGAASKTVKVKLAQGYTKESTIFEVYVMQCKNGQTVQTKITPSVMPPAAPNSYTPLTEATLDLSAYTGKVHIGFRYVGDGGQSLSSTWQIDDFSFNKDIVAETTVAISSANTTSVIKGQALNFTVNTTVTNGSGNTTIAATGVPSWITFTDNGNGTATLTGTAPAAVESNTINLTATNNSVSATQALTVAVIDQPAITNVVFNETCGTVEIPSTNRPSVKDYTGWDSKSPITFGFSTTSWADVRSTSTLNNHVWFPANKDTELKISNIPANHTGMKLSFKITGNAAGNANAIKVTCNGTELTIPSAAFAQNAYVEVKDIVIAEASTLNLVFGFTAATNTIGYRLDDIKIEGTPKN